MRKERDEGGKQERANVLVQHAFDCPAALRDVTSYAACEHEIRVALNEDLDNS